MQININKLLFIDIETVSQYEDLYDMSEDRVELWLKYYNNFRKKVTDESRIPESEDIVLGEDYQKEVNREVYRQTAAFFPEFGKICCISLGFITKDGEHRLESFSGDDENKILKDARKVLDKVVSLGFELCGQNIKNFDIPFLGKRYFINGLKLPTILPSYDTKPWDVKVVDTSDIWKFGGRWGLSSLELICDSLDIESPKNGDVKGDNIHDYFWGSYYDDIKNYCEKDVTATIEIITKFNNLK